jgi:Spy/CpxP family protein refolding chaperone
MKAILIIFALATLSVQASAGEPHHGMSPYADESSRAIKALSDTDMEELNRGGGWGFAKPAELNGYPGPSHLLQMKDQMGLTPGQIDRVQAIFEDMQRQAAEEGKKYIAAERTLDVAFKGGAVTKDQLLMEIRNAEESRARLRFIHLAAHLGSTAILTDEQIAKYNQHRGYTK